MSVMALAIRLFAEIYPPGGRNVAEAVFVSESMPIIKYRADKDVGSGVHNISFLW